MDSIQRIEPGQKAVVMGMGISGRAMVKFLLSLEVRVFVTDNRDFKDLPKDDQDYLKQNDIPFEGGIHREEFLSQGDFIAISPGIPTDLPVLNGIREKQIPIVGELAIAAPYLSECVVAVTGTNGKTTVTSLIGELLRASGEKVFVGGNIGTPILSYLLSGERADVLVLELSSFQLESAGSFRPHIGVLLNVTPDHLDRHKTMVNYAGAKMKMFAHQNENDKAILCSDDPMCQQIKPLLMDQEVYCFGDLRSNCAAKGGNGEISITLQDSVQKFSLAGTALDTYTGLLNSEAAILAVSLLGCRREAIEEGLKRFVPAKHRLQYVRKINGVDYYNDSKATNTGAVFSALASFSGNVILIAGGREKGEEYTVLKELIREKVKELVLIGEASDGIASAIGGVVSVHHAGSMEEAVSIAAGNALPGDVVLLAPACASFDMFENYGHRGDVFMRAVLDLPEAEEVRGA